MCILYKPDLDLYVADWLSHNNHAQNKDKEIMNVNIISMSMNIPVCMSIEYIQTATCEDAHLQKLQAYITQGLPHKREEVESMRKYWVIRNELATIDGIVMKGKKIITPCILQKQTL